MQSHVVPDVRIGEVQCREFDARVETVDRFHQVEGRAAENGFVVTGRDERGMRNPSLAERIEDPEFAADLIVASGSKMNGTAAQDVAPVGPPKTNHDVLGAAGDRGDVEQRSVAEVD